MISKPLEYQPAEMEIESELHDYWQVKSLRDQSKEISQRQG